MFGRRVGRAVVVYEHLDAEIPLDYHAIRPAWLLVQAGWDTHIVCRGDGPSPQRRDGASVWWERSLPAILRRVAALRPEVVFVETAVQGLPAAPFVTTWVRSALPSPNRLKQGLARRLLARAAAVSFTNPDGVSAWKGLNLKLTDLPYPLDVDFWRQRPPRRPALWAEMGVEVPPGPVVTYVANIAPRKRHAELVTALAPVLRSRPDLRLVLVGKPWEVGAGARARAESAGGGEALDEACRRHGVEHQVVRTGWQPLEVVREIFGWSTAQIIHSDSETQCLALYEGLAAGVPGLISDIPSLTTAFPVLPRHATEAQLADNVEALLAAPERGAELVAACQERVEWADVRRHDRLFYETMSRLVGRPVDARSA